MSLEKDDIYRELIKYGIYDVISSIICTYYHSCEKCGRYLIQDMDRLHCERLHCESPNCSRSYIQPYEFPGAPHLGTKINTEILRWKFCSSDCAMINLREQELQVELQELESRRIVHTHAQPCAECGIVLDSKFHVPLLPESDWISTGIVAMCFCSWECAFLLRGKEDRYVEIETVRSTRRRARCGWADVVRRWASW